MQKPDEGDGLPYTNLNLTHVDVDLNGLTDFRSLLQRELHINLRPVADGIIANHGVGVMFGGRTPGQGMYAARERYREALVASTQNLAHYIRTSELLITAVKDVTTNYRDSDLSAAAVIDAIRNAAAQIPPATQPADANPNIPPPVAGSMR